MSLEEYNKSNSRMGNGGRFTLAYNFIKVAQIFHYRYYYHKVRPISLRTNQMRITNDQLNTCYRTKGSFALSKFSVITVLKNHRYSFLEDFLEIYQYKISTVSAKTKPVANVVYFHF